MLPEWCTFHDVLLTDVDIRSSGTIEDSGCNNAHVDFANKMIGG